MEKKIITLGSEVMVSDPCYPVGTWCQTIIRGVLPGKYLATMPGLFEPFKGYSERNVGISVLHEHAHLAGRKITWKKYSTIGVDSGQAGIFDLASYRGGDHSDDRSEGSVGELWYDEVTKLTLDTVDNWGSTDSGIVSSSGLGDGMYNVHLAKLNRMVVGISIDFYITKTQKQFLQSLSTAF
jgi:hypothetical protein